MAFTFRPRLLMTALANAWPLWLALAGVVVAGGIGILLSTDPWSRVRYAGTFLQVFGLGTVAFGLSQVRRSFGRPSLLSKALEWFRQIQAAFKPPKHVTVEAKAAGLSIAAGRPRVFVTAGPTTPLDERVALLEQNLRRLQDEFDAHEERITKELRTVNEALTREHQARETEARRISTQLENFAVGGLHLEFIGVFWLVLGVLGTSIPTEIAALFS